MKKIKIPCDNIDLEGIIHVPKAAGLFPLVVVCHPHPLYGGNMYNYVVHAVCEELGEKRIAWLKFNFRGVGESGGDFGGGLGEKEDAKAAVAYGQGKTEIDPLRIGICGYSFGGMVAFAAAVEETRIRAAAGISPLIRPPDLLDTYDQPKLIVSGTADDFIPVQELEQLVAGMPEPKELVLYPGVDHFWSGAAEKMAEKVARFFEEKLT